jgi:transcriptional regulator with XRE-family HTH domain
MESERKYLGAKLKQLRLQKKMTQQEVGDKMGVAQTIVARWENGIHAPSEDNLKALSKLFDYDLELFLRTSVQVTIPSGSPLTIAPDSNTVLLNVIEDLRRDKQELNAKIQNLESQLEELRKMVSDIPGDILNITGKVSSSQWQSFRAVLGLIPAKKTSNAKKKSEIA